MAMDQHLTLREITLLPGGEWFARGKAWVVIRVAEGAGYWLGQEGAREVAGGCLVCAPGDGGGRLRASSLGPLRFQFFLVQPRLLTGILALAESTHLEPGGSRPLPSHLLQPASHPAARKFAELAGHPLPGVALRCGLLQVWAEIIAPLVPASPPAEDIDLRQRVRRRLGEMGAAELAACTLPELAIRLSCSERHLSRVFHEEFGCSFRAHQTEARLSHARQLLAGTDAKVIEVAYDSGYKHLGLFNTMFRKRFGMTPTQWRQRSQKNSPARRQPRRDDPAPRARAQAGQVPPVRLMAAVRLLLASCLICLPGASLLAQTNVVSNTPPAEPRFEVRRYDVRGNTLLKEESIDKILGAAKGPDITLTQIRRALGDLQAAYRERGFATVAVTLPQQQLTNATVIVQVMEGPVTRINVVNNRYFSSNNVMEALPSLREIYAWSNITLNSHVFQRELDAANANRDRQVFPLLGPGPDPGTSELTLKVKDRLPLHGRFELNNMGTPGTPDVRMNLNAQYANLWQLEHQLGFQYSFSPTELKATDLHKDTWLDYPLVASYSAYYRMPLGEPTGVQQQLDGNNLGFGYNEVTHQFNLPPLSTRPELNFFASRSTSDTGIKLTPLRRVTETSFITIDTQESGQDVTLNQGFGGRLTLPLPETAGVRSTLSLGFDFKQYQLTSFNTNIFDITTIITNSFGQQTITRTVPNGQPPREVSLDYLPLTAGLDLSIPDKLGTTYFNVNAAFNPLNGGSRNDAMAGNPGFAQASYSTNARASYVTLNMGVTREVPIYRDWSVLLRANGQWANGPLISNEQFAMGGVAGVRGYLDGQAYGDSGWRVLVEPRTPLIKLGMVDNTVPFWLRASVFMDYGTLYYADRDAAGTSSRDFWGAGFGATATIGDHLDGRLSVGWPLLDAAGRKAGEPRFYFGLGIQF